MEQYLNPAQRQVMAINARDNVIVGGRGLGKGVIHALWMLRNMQRMQGSSGGIVAPNIKRCLTNTLPSMLIHWDRWGYKRGVHWAIGIRPPKKWGWAEPVFQPENWQNTLSFCNGSVAFIISQDRAGTSNSLSLDYLDIDEAKFIDFDQLKDETFPANRGNRDRWGHHYYHHGMLITSDMPTTKRGSWFMNYKNQCDEELIDAIGALAIREWDLRQKIKTQRGATEAQRRHYRELSATLARLRSKALFYKEYSSLWNLEVLGEDYIKKMKRDLPPLVFRTSIMCLPLGQATDGFYACLSKDNLYSAPNTAYLDSLDYDLRKLEKPDSRMDADCDPDKPLCIGLDANANINWLVVGQHAYPRMEIKTLKSFWVKYERKLPELLDDFMAYYAHHREKRVIFYFDHTFTGNNYAVSDEDFHAFITHYLQDHGWDVVDVYIGHTMQPLERMLLINRMLKGRARNKILINEENNEDLLLSLRSAGVYNGRKDKRGEKLAETEEDRLEGRTDGSDAADTLWVGMEKFPMDYSGTQVISLL